MPGLLSQDCFFSPLLTSSSFSLLSHRFMVFTTAANDRDPTIACILLLCPHCSSSLLPTIISPPRWPWVHGVHHSRQGLCPHDSAHPVAPPLPHFALQNRSSSPLLTRSCPLMLSHRFMVFTTAATPYLRACCCYRSSHTRTDPHPCRPLPPLPCYLAGSWCSPQRRMTATP